MDLHCFRVNAGVAHSYAWCPDDKTACMATLKGGAKVPCVDVQGNTRVVTVTNSALKNNNWQSR